MDKKKFLVYSYLQLPSEILYSSQNSQAQRDMYLLLSRFILFYNSGKHHQEWWVSLSEWRLHYSHNIFFLLAADKLESFLKQCPDFPNAILVGGPADIFVTELTDQVYWIPTVYLLRNEDLILSEAEILLLVQLQKLKVEPVLLHYLKEIKVVQGTIHRSSRCFSRFSYIYHTNFSGILWVILHFYHRDGTETDYKYEI